MKKTIITIVATLLVLIIFIIVYIYSGFYDVSQLKPHNPLTLWAINTTVEHSVDKRLKDIKVPPLNDTLMIRTGFRHYNEMCEICHGGPGTEPGELVKGLYPQPPEFYKMEMPEPEESFWIIRNGIKMTSMPAFGPTHSDELIWDMTAFLLNRMNSMTPEEYAEWVKKYSD